ncbi:MAG: hypothetical protein AB8H03_20755 [Saprospiraceae bacterium]
MKNYLLFFIIFTFPFICFSQKDDLMHLIISEKVKQVSVEDLLEKDFEQGNKKRILTTTEQEEFVLLIKMTMDDSPGFYDHFKFKVEFENGDTIDVFTNLDKINANNKFRRIHVYNLNYKFAFDKLANYNKKINKKLELIGLKSDKPTSNWIEHFLLFNDGYIYTVEGISKAEIAFDKYIMNFMELLDNGELDKKKAYSFVQELYLVFNGLDENGELNIDTEMREEICAYADTVLILLDLFEKDYEYKYGIERDW